MIFLAPIVVGVGSALLRAVAGRAVIGALVTAFRAGSIRGIAVALVKIAVGAIVRYFTVTALVSWFQQSVEYIFRFNWNISDKEIDAQIQNSLNSLASIAGGTLGQTLGALTCTTVQLYVSPSAMLYLGEISDEVIDELAAAWGGLIRAATYKFANAAFLLGFKSLRSWLKRSGIAALFLGEYAAEQWGKSSYVISFAKAWEDWVESIQPMWLQFFIEEFAEEAWESCKEFQMIVANYADMALAAGRRSMKDATLGQEALIEVQPNRDLDETIVLSGRSEILKAQTVQVLAQHQLLGNRDVGDDLGNFRTTLSRSEPISLELKIRWYSVAKPPYVAKYAPNGVLTKAEISLPCVKRTALDWDKIKTAAGGSNGYLWGRFKTTCRAEGTQGGIHSIIIYAGSEAEGEQRIMALLELTDLKLLTLSVTEEKRVGRRATNIALYKENCQVYPAWFSIINQEKVLSEENSFVLLKGNYRRRKSEKIRLWPQSKPPQVEENIAEALRTPGQSD